MSKEKLEVKNAYEQSFILLEEALGFTDNGVPLAKSVGVLTQKVRESAAESMARFNLYLGDAEAATFADMGFRIVRSIRDISSATEASAEFMTGDHYRQYLETVHKHMGDLKIAEKFTETYMR